ncbi:MAG: hypothetical protein K8T25_23285 [Planctomycetia bacterium]|nr:hypothetical protein [Planctomycetia bacterium]
MRNKFTIFSRLMPAVLAGWGLLELGVLRAPAQEMGPRSAADVAIADEAPAGAVPTREAPARVEPAGAGSGDVVLASSVDALVRYQSISASVRQQVNLFGQRLFGTGVYVQSGTGPRRRVRLEMTIQGKREKYSTTRVSDGNILWLLDSQGAQQSLRVVDLRRVEDTVAVADPPPPNVWRQAEVGWGGLPRLMAAWQENFQFATAQPTNLGDVPVWVLRGRWQPARLKALLADSAESTKQARDSGKLPQQVPDEVVVYLGQEDKFPYRFEYRSSRTANGQQTVDSQIIVAMDLFRVQLNLPIDPAQFARPADLQQIDDTEAFLKRLGIASRRK